MTNFILNRLLQSVALLFGVLILVFFMIRLTGDPTSLMVSRQASVEEVERVRAELGFDRPLEVQLLDYLSDVLRGNLGISLSLDQPNSALLMERLPATIELAVGALFIAIVIGVPLGIVSGMYQNTVIDYLARFTALIGQTVPNFWLAMIFIVLFSVRLRWFPTFGRDGLRSIVLPAFALSLLAMGQFVRVARSAVLEARRSNFVRTAHAKGLHPARVTIQHITPNALIPLISVIGIQFTYMLGGSIYIETIFSWPGLGRLLNDAIQNSDFPLVQAITIFIAIFAISVNLLTDILYGLTDPRIRQQ
ncbi:MAG: ABC transporter permease [Chloroflexota bacterium]